MLSISGLLGPTRRRVLEIFLAAVGGYIEQAIGVSEVLYPARIARVSVEYIIAHAEENAKPVAFAMHVAHISFLGHLFLALKVVFEWRFALIESYMKIVVEVAIE